MAMKSEPEWQSASRSKSAPPTAPGTTTAAPSALHTVSFTLTFTPTFVPEHHATQFSFFFATILSHLLNPGIKTAHRFWRTDDNTIETTMQFAATEKVRLEVLRLIWDAYVGAKWQGHVKIDSREMNDLYRHDGGRKKVVAKKETGAEEDGSKKHGAKKYGSKKEG